MHLSAEQIKLLDAAGRGDVETVNALVAGGVDVNTPDHRSLPRNRTALMHAAKGGHLEIVELLLRAGASIDEKDKGMGPALPGGRTALLLALENKHVRIAQKLLSAGADPNVTSRGLTVLGQAAALGDVALVRQVLKAGVDPNVVLSKKAELPLISALFANHTEIVRALLSGGADPDLPRARGRQPLELAIQEGLVEAVKLLLHRGADAERSSAGGMTPLMLAVNCGQKQIVKILLQREVALNTRNQRGLTALDLAQQKLNPSGHDLTLPAQRQDGPENLARFHEIIAMLRSAGARTAAELPPERKGTRAKPARRRPSVPARLKNNSARQPGIKDFLEMVHCVEPEFSVIAVKTSLERTIAAFVQFRGVKRWIRDIPCQNAVKITRPNPSVIAVVKVRGSSWTVIYRSVFCLATEGAQATVEEAKELSARLRTKALALVRDSTEETMGYDFFGRGRRWEHGRWADASSAYRFQSRFRRKPGKDESPEDFTDKVFRQQRIYLPAGHARHKGRSSALNLEKVSAGTVLRADILLLAGRAKRPGISPPAPPRRR